LELELHPFFSSLNWEGVFEKQFSPPYRPQTSSPTDISHFEEIFTEEAAEDSLRDSSAVATTNNMNRTRKWLTGVFRAFDMLADSDGGRGRDDGKTNSDGPKFRGFEFRTGSL